MCQALLLFLPFCFSFCCFGLEKCVTDDEWVSNPTGVVWVSDWMFFKCQWTFPARQYLTPAHTHTHRILNKRRKRKQKQNRKESSLPRALFAFTSLQRNSLKRTGRATLFRCNWARRQIFNYARMCVVIVEKGFKVGFRRVLRGL